MPSAPDRIGTPAVYAIATMDTKGAELAYVAQQLTDAGVSVVTVDVGTQSPPVGAPNVSRETLAACHPDGKDAVFGHTDRGQAISAMSGALRGFLLREHQAQKVAGVIGMGGSGGSALIAPAMRALPIGLPKVLISTVAGGDVAPYVGGSDIVMFPSIVDVAGLNSVSRRILGNAANALAGMVTGDIAEAASDRPTIGMTMFGVTTTCVEAVRRELEAAGFDCLVFHATGTGGRSMEDLVAAGLIRGVLDITTTEVADEVVGGVLTAGPQRFDDILDASVPYVLSLGALDMVNFWAKDTVPEQFLDRTLHVHNANVTLMRTTPDENRQFARWIATKLNRSKTPITVLIPEHGVSAIDAAGQPFHDPDADAALFTELEQLVEQTPERVIKRLPLHINDPEFSAALVREFQAAWEARQTAQSP